MNKHPQINEDGSILLGTIKGAPIYKRPFAEDDYYIHEKNIIEEINACVSELCKITREDKKLTKEEYADALYDIIELSSAIVNNINFLDEYLKSNYGHGLGNSDRLYYLRRDMESLIVSSENQLRNLGVI
jgi:hypothetical protein